MIERFEGESGRRLRVDALAAQKMVCGNWALAEELAEELADRVRLRAEGYCQVGRIRGLWHDHGHEHDVQSVPRVPLPG
jgi:hypothetical protein